jgi:hypothetical protein
MSKFFQGTYVPKNPEKYVGNVNNISFRSSWEKKAMVFFDNNPGILKWASEELVIPYISPVDGREHRYFPDFIVVSKSPAGVIKKMVVEVKPASQCEPPKTKKKTKRMITEMNTFMVNQAKWDAARTWCSRNNMEFIVLTEVDLGIR